MMGFLYGVWRLQSPLPKTWLGKGSWLARVGIRGILAERPIIYEVLNPEMRDGVQKLVFVELEMKSDVGFYSGQLDQFAIVKDEQPHKPIFLINVWWKKNRAEQYEQLESDGLMVDLADVAILQTKQVADGAQQGTPS